MFSLTDDRRELVELERLAEILAARPVESPELIEAIKLSNKSFSAEAAALLAQTLQNFQNLVHADISDVIAGRPEEEALQVLRHICDALRGRALQILDLSDNALGAKGIHACRGVLENQDALHTLLICNNGLSAEAAELVAEILLYRTPTKLQKFHFYNNMSGDQGAKNLAPIISSSPELVDLRFSATRAGREGSRAIAESLANVPGLIRLDLSDNTFAEEGAAVLAVALEKQTQLEEVNLRDASLNYEGSRDVIRALTRSGAPLKFIDLSSNDMTNEIVEDLCDLIASKPLLEVVMLDENELGTDGAKMLAGVLQGLTHLREVSLQSNDLTAAGAVAVTLAVKDKPMQRLELDGNAICEEGVQRVTAVLESVGKRGILGELEDNDEDGDNDLDAEEDEEVDELAEAAANLNI